MNIFYLLINQPQIYNLNLDFRMSRSKLYGYYENYESAQTILQKQTAALLAQRHQLQSKLAANQPSRSKIRQPFAQSTLITPVAMEKKVDSNKTQEVINKLQQIIKLCKQEGSLSNQEMKEVIKVQKQVQSFLQNTNSEIEPTLINPHFEQNAARAMIKNLHQNQQKYEGQQILHYQNQPKFRTTHYQVDKKIIEQNNESRSKIDSPQVLKSRQDINQANPVLIHQTWGKEQRFLPYSEDSLQIIAQIQRKALGEIINLQQERDNIKKERDLLSSQLQKVKAQAASNQQHIIQKVQQQQQQLRISRTKLLQVEKIIQQNKILRANSAENNRIKQQNMQLRQENQSLLQRIQYVQAASTQNIRQRRKTDLRETYPQYHEPKTGLAHGQYDSQIAVYQNQLRRATVVINQLRSRLANIPGLQELHEQGERIRKETTELLQTKIVRGTAQSQESMLIRELKERLQEQEKGKALFFQQLKAFKQRYYELQQQNKALKKSKVIFDPVPRMAGSIPQRQSTPNRGIIKKRNNYFGQYEQTLNEMKRVLY